MRKFNFLLARLNNFLPRSARWAEKIFRLLSACVTWNQVKLYCFSMLSPRFSMEIQSYTRRLKVSTCATLVGELSSTPTHDLLLLATHENIKKSHLNNSRPFSPPQQNVVLMLIYSNAVELSRIILTFLMVDDDFDFSSRSVRRRRIVGSTNSSLIVH